MTHAPWGDVFCASDRAHMSETSERYRASADQGASGGSVPTRKSVAARRLGAPARLRGKGCHRCSEEIHGRVLTLWTPLGPVEAPFIAG